MALKNKEEYNAYMREYQKRRYEQRRAMFIEELGGVCAQCGSEDSLEFDHIDPQTKSFNLAKKMVSGALAVLREEVQKCQLLCYTCHKKKSVSEEKVEHGTGKTGVRNCRCELCGPLKNAYMRELKRKKAEQKTALTSQ